MLHSITGKIRHTNGFGHNAPYFHPLLTRFLAHLPLATADRRSRRWLTRSGFTPARLEAAGIRVATIDTAQQAYTAAGIDANRARDLGLPGPAELHGQGRNPKGGEPLQMFGKGRESVLVCPFYDPFGHVVEIATVALPKRRRPARHFGRRGKYRERETRVPYGLQDRERISEAESVILTVGILSQLHLAQMDYAALALRPGDGYDWSGIYLEFCKDKKIQLAFPNDAKGRKLTEWLLQRLPKHWPVEVLAPEWYGTDPDVAARSTSLHQEGQHLVILPAFWVSADTWRQQCREQPVVRPATARRSRRGLTLRQLRNVTRLSTLKVHATLREAWERAGFDKRGSGELAVSITQLQTRTGLSRQAVFDGLAQAREQGLIKGQDTAQGRTTTYNHVTPLPPGLSAAALLPVDSLVLIKAAIATAQYGMAASIRALALLIGTSWRSAKRAWNWLRSDGLQALFYKDHNDPVSTVLQRSQQDQAALVQAQTSDFSRNNSLFDGPEAASRDGNLARALQGIESLESLISTNPVTADSRRGQLERLLHQIGVYPQAIERVFREHTLETVSRHLASTLAYAPARPWSWFLSSLRRNWRLPDQQLIRQCRELGIEAPMVQRLLLDHPGRVPQQLAWLPARRGIRDQAAALIEAVFADWAAPPPPPLRPQRAKPEPEERETVVAARPEPEAPSVLSETSPGPFTALPGQNTELQVLCREKPDLVGLWRYCRAWRERQGRGTVLHIAVPHALAREIVLQGDWRVRSLRHDGWRRVVAQLAPEAEICQLTVEVDPALQPVWDWPTLARDVIDTAWADLGSQCAPDLEVLLPRCRPRWDGETLHLSVPRELSGRERRALGLALQLRMGAPGYLDVTQDDRLRDGEAEMAALIEIITEAQVARGRDADDVAALVRQYTAQYGLDYVWDQWDWVCQRRRVRNPVGLWRRACERNWD